MGIELEFNDQVAKRELENYRRKGPSKTTHLILEGLEKYDAEGLTLLDIGGGVGAIQQEMLEAGLRRVINVDASSAYQQAAKEEAARRDTLQRVNYYHGDFVELSPELEEADIVTLDRVICCYDNAEELLRQSLSKSRKVYALSYPKDRWWMRFFFWGYNLFMRVRDNPFRIFVHPVKKVESMILTSGFREVFRSDTFLWNVVGYTRTSA
jgi:magnesium-protoporphyrin O-methyltransferase